MIKPQRGAWRFCPERRQELRIVPRSEVQPAGLITPWRDQGATTPQRFCAVACGRRRGAA